MLDVKEKNTILGLRLLVARAAQKDSLNWWEDDSLTQSGDYLLERLFLTDPGEAGRKLALEAARTRYQAAFNGDDSAIHLFHLDRTGDVEYDLLGIRLVDIPIPSEPMPTRDMLRQSLLDLTGQPPQFKIVGERADHRLEIGMQHTVGRVSVVNIAAALAWASLEGKPGQPVFPYITSSL